MDQWTLSLRRFNFLITFSYEKRRGETYLIKLNYWVGFTNNFNFFKLFSRFKITVWKRAKFPFLGTWWYLQVALVKIMKKFHKFTHSLLIEKLHRIWYLNIFEDQDTYITSGMGVWVALGWFIINRFSFKVLRVQNSVFRKGLWLYVCYEFSAEQ